MIAWLRTHPDLGDADLAQILALATPTCAEDAGTHSAAHELAVACIFHPAAGPITLTPMAAQRAWPNLGDAAVARVKDQATLAELAGIVPAARLPTLAWHPDLPSDVLPALLAHPARRTRHAAALHPRTPATETLRILTDVAPESLFRGGTEEAGVAVALSAHPELLGSWAQKTRHADVLQAVAQHPESYRDPESRARIEASKSPWMAQFVLGNPFWPQSSYRPWPVSDSAAISYADSAEPSEQLQVVGWRSATLIRRLLSNGNVSADALDALLAAPRKDLFPADIRLAALVGAGTSAAAINYLEEVRSATIDRYRLAPAGSLGPGWFRHPARTGPWYQAEARSSSALTDPSIAAVWAADRGRLLDATWFARYHPDLATEVIEELLGPWHDGVLTDAHLTAIRDANINTAGGARAILEGAPAEWARAWDDGQR